MWSNWFQIVLARMYDSLVHICAVGIQDIRVYFATKHKCLGMVLENEMWRLQRMGVNTNI